MFFAGPTKRKEMALKSCLGLVLVVVAVAVVVVSSFFTAFEDDLRKRVCYKNNLLARTYIFMTAEK